MSDAIVIVPTPQGIVVIDLAWIRVGIRTAEIYANQVKA